MTAGRMIRPLQSFCHKDSRTDTPGKGAEPTMKHLIVGLGNPGREYEHTRHNTGFMIVDHLALKEQAPAWEDHRYGFTTRLRIKNQELILLKPTTYMNLSGNAVRYWMNKENIALENLLVVADDLSLPLGQIRIKPKGSDAGHNGLGNIASVLCTQEYARLRFGIGNDFPKGTQVDYVLGRFSPEDDELLKERLDIAAEAIRSLCLSGIARTMNQYNKK